MLPTVSPQLPHLRRNVEVLVVVLAARALARRDVDELARGLAAEWPEKQHVIWGICCARCGQLGCREERRVEVEACAVEWVRSRTATK